MMVHRAKLAALCAVLLVLTACGNKQKQASKNAPMAETETATQTAPTQSCPSPPADPAVANTLVAAMQDVYGSEDAPAKIAVAGVARAADCDHLTVTYGAPGSAEKQKATLTYANNGWQLDLYKKHYPVR